MENVLKIKNRNEFREWFINNHSTEKECWIVNLKRGKPLYDNVFYYIDAVEEALCFGWIDSVYKKVDDTYYQRFSPRSKNSNWTVLNVARVKRLTSLGLMNEAGLKVAPKEDYVFDKDIINDIKKSGVYETFIKAPILYQQIRVSNLSSIKKISKEKYQSSLANLIKMTKENKMTSGWDDYGRLSSFSY